MLPKLNSAVLVGAFHKDLPIIDAAADVLVQTLKVVDVCAVENGDHLRVHSLSTDGAIIVSEVQTHHDVLLRIVRLS